MQNCVLRIPTRHKESLYSSPFVRFVEKISRCAWRWKPKPLLLIPLSLPARRQRGLRPETMSLYGGPLLPSPSSATGYAPGPSDAFASETAFFSSDLSLRRMRCHRCRVPQGADYCFPIVSSRCQARKWPSFRFLIHQAHGSGKRGSLFFLFFPPAPPASLASGTR